MEINRNYVYLLELNSSITSLDSYPADYKIIEGGFELWNLSLKNNILLIFLISLTLLGLYFLFLIIKKILN